MLRVESGRIQMRPQVNPPTESNLSLFEGALNRARANYIEMPGLQLTHAQAARLWGLDSALCGSILTALVESHFLVQTGSSFVRA